MSNPAEQVSSGSPLGRSTASPTRYAPDVLFGIPRAEGRASLGLTDPLPFAGVDLWNAYELSWLDDNGTPVVATAELWVPATSPCIVESKSLKLYLSSLNDTRHASADAFGRVIAEDVGRVVGSEVDVRIAFAPTGSVDPLPVPDGLCIDDERAPAGAGEVDANLLDGSTDAAREVHETLYSNLLRSQCPVTGQPDWGTLIVRYRGPRIDRGALLRYIVSYRNHGEFHEQCVERCFRDIAEHCRPAELTVHARYTRRGGVDINPFRSNFESLSDNRRAWRQ